MSGIRYELLGVDGVLWKFGDPACPIRLAKTPTGLGGAPFKHQRVANARQAGADWVGRDDEPNVIGLEATLGPMPPGKPARDVFKAWRRSLGYGDEVGEFRVRLDDELYWQETRFEETSPDPEIDLLDDIGWMRDKVKLGSDLSWWHAPAKVHVFTATEWPTAVLVNDGDVDSWPHIRLDGPGKFDVGIGETVHLPMIQAGQSWVIETDPERAYIRDGNGVDRWPLVGVQRFSNHAPRHSTTPIYLYGINVGPTTKATVTLPQLYRRGTG